MGGEKVKGKVGSLYYTCGLGWCSFRDRWPCDEKKKKCYVFTGEDIGI